MFDERRKAQALRTSFSGKGKRGLRELLKMGNILQVIKSDEDKFIHNDRCFLINVMVGNKNMDALVDKVCDAILELSQDA